MRCNALKYNKKRECLVRGADQQPLPVTLYSLNVEDDVNHLMPYRNPDVKHFGEAYEDHRR